MKFVWEESDIKAGRKMSRKGLNEVWMIGYSYNAEGKVFQAVSLSDGLITEQQTAYDLAVNLNRDGYIPLEYLESI